MAWHGVLLHPLFFFSALAFFFDQLWLYLPAFIFFVLATIAIPGYMTFYCKKFCPSEIYNPFKAFSRMMQGGSYYWKAWGIVCVMLAGSFLGLLAFGIGFLFTSVWFWQAAGFSFATVFTPQVR